MQELQFSYTTGQTLTAALFDADPDSASSGFIWDGTQLVDVAGLVGTAWRLAFAEIGTTGEYRATRPAALDSETLRVKVMNGATPNLSDAEVLGGEVGLTNDSIADQVWEEAIADHSGTAGSTAEQLAAAGAAGDPWATALPGAYSAGQAGRIVGDNLNATVGSRATQTSVDTIDDFVDTEVAAILADTNDIQTRLPAALVSGRMDSNFGAIKASVLTDLAGANFNTFYESGGFSSGSEVRNVASIKAKTDQLTFTTPNFVDATAQVDTTGIADEVAAALSGSTIIVQSIVLSDGTIELVEGDDYESDDGRAIVLTITNYSGPSVSGNSFELGLTPTDDYQQGEVADVLSLNGIGVMDGADAVFTFEATSAQTEALEASPPEQKFNYVYQLRMLVGGRKITLLLGSATVKGAVL